MVEEVAPGDGHSGHPSGNVDEAIIIVGEGTFVDPDVSHGAWVPVTSQRDGIIVTCVKSDAVDNGLILQEEIPSSEGDGLSTSINDGTSGSNDLLCGRRWSSVQTWRPISFNHFVYQRIRKSMNSQRMTSWFFQTQWRWHECTDWWDSFSEHSQWLSWQRRMCVCS